MHQHPRTIDPPGRPNSSTRSFHVSFESGRTSSITGPIYRLGSRGAGLTTHSGTDSARARNSKVPFSPFPGASVSLADMRRIHPQEGDRDVQMSSVPVG